MKCGRVVLLVETKVLVDRRRLERGLDLLANEYDRAQASEQRKAAAPAMRPAGL